MKNPETQRKVWSGGKLRKKDMNKQTNLKSSIFNQTGLRDCWIRKAGYSDWNVMIIAMSWMGCQAEIFTLTFFTQWGNICTAREACHIWHRNFNFHHARKHKEIFKKLDLTEVLHEKRFTQILVAHLTAGSYNILHHHTLQVKCRKEHRAGKRNVW